MNVYVVVEGEKTEKLVYTSWIPIINSDLTLVQRMEDAIHNNFFIEAGYGYPQLFKIASAAMENIATYRPHGASIYDRLVIAVDSEDNTPADKYKEIEDFIVGECAVNGWTIDYRIIIQHFCFETWALGNRKLLSGNISDPVLTQYIKDFNVSKKDPELLPPRPLQQLNRAKHAFKYLKLLFNEKYPSQGGYTKSNPGPVCHKKYFQQLKSRMDDDVHIQSFSAALNAFV